jgi:hypothetical protein
MTTLSLEHFWAPYMQYTFFRLVHIAIDLTYAYFYSFMSDTLT